MQAQSACGVFVIGGGLNACGIAHDAAGCRYSGVLAETNDLSNGASPKTTKRLHGDLRYVEHCKAPLPREAWRERDALWRLAPHIIRPLRWVLIHVPALHPAWILRLGLFLYDQTGGRELLPPRKTLDMRRDSAARPLKPILSRAFEFSDGWRDDAGLVVLNARDPADRGAGARTRVTTAERSDSLWKITLAGIVHLVEREWAMTGEDVAWRRTKLGLHVGDSEKERVVKWLRDRVAARALEGA